MKLSNFFKRETEQSAKSRIQPLAKNQLSKVIGGGDGDVTTSTELKTKHDAAMAAIQNTR